jgi:hypothetical protein
MYIILYALGVQYVLHTPNKYVVHLGVRTDLTKCI